MEKFVETIYSNLTRNGFPEKKVSLPTEKMYEIADSKGLSLNSALEELAQKYQVVYDIGDEKIIFETVERPTDGGGFDFSQFANNDMFKKAQEMMSKMDPSELKAMQEKVMNMSESEREEIMQKGKNLGLF